MKAQIRKGVFETNSSSVHTLVLNHEGDYKLELKVKNGKVDAYCDDFSGTGMVWGQQEKLNYAITYAELYANSHGQEVEECYYYLEILDAIREVEPSVEGIVVHNKKRASFDHQTAPQENDFIVEIYNKEQLVQFLFNNDLNVKMSRD